MLPSLAVIALLVFPQQEPLAYDQALQQSEREKRPLLVIVSAKWCGSCQVMKRDTILPMLRDREFRDAIVVIVDKDQEPEVAAKLMQGESLPQTVLIDRPGPNRKRFTLPGMQDRSRIRELLRKIFK